MKVLAIDTSSEVLGVAILDEEGSQLEFNYNFGLRHASHLVPTIKLLLKFSKLELKDIDAYCVSIGPGSFTGLRIGVSTIKALALVNKKKVVAVPSLDVLAYNVAYTEDTICVIVDAKKEKLYARLYKYNCHCEPRRSRGEAIPREEIASSGFALLAMTPALLIDCEELLNRLSKIKNGIVLIGDGIEKIRNLKQKIKFAGKELWHPRAINVARIGLEMLKKGKVVKDIDKLVPMYLHPKDVQCKK